MHCVSSETELIIFAAASSSVPDLIMQRLLSGRVNGKTASRRRAGKSDECSYTAYRFLALPAPGQEQKLRQIAGSTRWMWNHMKADDDAFHKATGRFISRTPAWYKPDNPWLYDMDSLALANVQLQYQRARSEWLSGEKRQPRFKKKGLSADSYTTNNVGGNIKLGIHGIKLPKIDSFIRLRQHRRIKEGGLLKSATVTHEPDGRWYVSILMEYPKADYEIPFGIEAFLETGDVSAIRHTGLDMSLPHLYVDANGDTPSYDLKDSTVRFEKAYRRLEGRIAREQRKLSHMVRGSNNYIRQCRKTAKLHAKAKHQRLDFLHQMSVRLVRANDIISIEDLDIAGMKKALKFGKSLSDNGWGTFTRLLQEKGLAHGCLIVKVDKFFPSSKTCSRCGYAHRELKLSDRTYVCPVCGIAIDRDEQAAGNIDAEGLRLVIESLLEGNRYKEAVSSGYTSTAGTAGLGCNNYGAHAKPFSSETGNMPKMSPDYAAKMKGCATA